MSSHEPFTLAYSPCPNDTYIFAAWTNGLLEGAPPVSVALEDIEALNEAARERRYALTKASYGAIPLLLNHYRIFRAGGALGRGCGPLVVALPGPDGTAPPLSSLRPHVRIAIPGALTTAYLLFRLAFGRPIEAAPMRFDRIVDAVTRGEADAGLIIHESRFTYEKAGLVLVEDLGAWWERETGLPIPLGAILARRDLSIDDEELLQSTIRASLAFARANEAAVAPYVREHATEMDEDVMRAHIALYVNEFTDDIGDEGIKAVHQLFELAGEARILPRGIRPQFV